MLHRISGLLATVLLAAANTDFGLGEFVGMAIGAENQKQTQPG